MKKIFMLLAMFIAPACSLYAYEICGVAVTSDEISYTPVEQIEASEIHLGFWAVGSGCVGQTAGNNFAGMCTSVIVGGSAFCGSATWGSADLNEDTASNGAHCWCRRTKLLRDGTLTDSIGQGIVIGDMESNESCAAGCAERCANSVATNDNGMRNAIMLLDAF